jgi:hypothetical protein
MVNDFISKYKYSGRIKIDQKGENGGFYLNLVLGVEQIELLSTVHEVHI